MSKYVVTAPTLDDWPAVRDFVKEFNESVFASRIHISDKAFEEMFILSMMPQSILGVLVLWRNRPEEFGLRWVPEEVIGVAVVNETNELISTAFVRRTFLRGVYIRPQESLKAAVVMDRAIDKWARVRSHDMVYAYVRRNTAEHGNNGFKLRAVQKRFGYEPMFEVIGKHLYGVPEGRTRNGQKQSAPDADHSTLAGNRADPRTGRSPELLGGEWHDAAQQVSGAL